MKIRIRGNEDAHNWDIRVINDDGVETNIGQLITGIKMHAEAGSGVVYSLQVHPSVVEMEYCGRGAK